MPAFELVRRNLHHTMRCFARATPECSVREMPGLLITDAAVESPVFNAAFLTAPIGDDPVELDRRVAMAKVYFDARGRNWSFWLCDEYLAPGMRGRAASILAARGLSGGAECPGMFASKLVPRKRDLPSVIAKRVGNAETRLEFCHITTVCFRIPFETSLAIYNEPATWKTDFTAYVGYLGDEPVATAATVNAAGAIGLYSIATLPEYQGRGIAERLTRDVITAAQPDGESQPIVLQSTSQGDALYRRLGFREVTRISVYVARP
jgi:ribosomal protein S18 acetylase RimI-like enzyme